MPVTNPKGRRLLDAQGNPIVGDKLQSVIASLRKKILNLKYDAAQTNTKNQLHWANADTLDPHSSSSSSVRRTLRSRARYEIIENNPYLKGNALTLCNDFVKSGPKLQIKDQRIAEETKKNIEMQFSQWAKQIKLRRKLWRLKMAKSVDGEGFGILYLSPRIRLPVNLNLQIIEADRFDSFNQLTPTRSNNQPPEVDGVRINTHEEPTHYHLLHHHPSTNSILGIPLKPGGRWIREQFIAHWYRQDRGWLRGVPELAPSLHLCSLLRRYTLAVVQHAEVAADFTAIMETEGPGSTLQWTDGAGTLLDDDPFDIFPIERGMIVNLPWGYKLKQLDAVPLGIQYDQFVGSLLREILRPWCIPWNIGSGSSRESNMASAVVDSDLYQSSQQEERYSCEEEILDKIFSLWWSMAILMPGFLDPSPSAGMILENPSLREFPPIHQWNWDKIGKDHTDPTKVASALAQLHDKKFITDRDIQEQYYNRDLETWREEVQADDEFRSQFQEVPTESTLPFGEEEDEEEDD